MRWKLNALEYFEAPGLSVLIFHNAYPEGKQGGIEIIQHGERIATNGDLRLEPTPGQWSPLPVAGERRIDAARGEVDVPLHYPDANLDGLIRVQAEGAALRIAVDLTEPLPPERVGRLSLNLELCPAVYFGKTFHLGGTFGIFPRQANGPLIAGPDGNLQPLPLANGPRLVVAPEDPLHRLVIEQDRGELALFDGRDTAPNGWFVVRSILPTGTTRDAVVWRVTPNSVPAWRRPPVICISQVGYHPTPPFKISQDVYRCGVWQPTLETFLPVQMCHVEVRDRYRVWHGACHLDDALQAPPSHVHFDGYRQGPETETPYAPYEHVPGLDRGGWHDAGDYDLAAGSQAMTTFALALIRETFGVDSD